MKTNNLDNCTYYAGENICYNLKEGLSEFCSQNYCEHKQYLDLKEENELLKNEIQVLEKVNSINQEKIKTMNEKLCDMDIARQYGNEAFYLLEVQYNELNEKLSKSKEMLTTLIEQTNLYPLKNNLLKITKVMQEN